MTKCDRCPFLIPNKIKCKAHNIRPDIYSNRYFISYFLDNYLKKLQFTPHSHSIVPGGFDVTSYTTRFTPFTSLMIRVAARPKKFMS